MFETSENDYSEDERLQWRVNGQHGELLAHRFSSLVLKGYRPIVHCELDFFDFEHPHKKAIQVQLRADGQLVDRYPSSAKDGSRTIIAPDDDQLFDRFLAQIPKPTELQRMGATPLSEALMMVLLWVGIYVLGSIIWAIAKAAWGFVAER